MKNMSIVNRGLRYKLRIAFGLMSVIPLLACIYLFLFYSPYIAKIPFSNLQVSLAIGISIIIAGIGFIVAKQIVDPIVEISTKAKVIAKGEFDKTIDVYGEDEIGDLGNALNQLTRRIRDNMDELRNYGERTKEINAEINRRVVVLSGLLQISNLITQGAKLKEVFEISVEKLSQLKDATLTILVIKDEYNIFKICAQAGISEALSDSLLKEGFKKIFNSILLHKNGWIVNEADKSLDCEEAKQIFSLQNIIFTPVFRHTRVVGFISVGSSQAGTQYNNDDLELLSVFTKQIAIAIENDYLINRLQKLEIKDSLTGLYNKNFIVTRLDEEIKRAIIYQRPCSFLLVSIDKFSDFLGSFGQLESEEVLRKVAKTLEANCSEIDRVARYGDNDFAVIIPEKNKKQTTVLANDIRNKIEEIFSKDDEKKKLTICGAVSENPIDGACAKDLIQKAESLLNLAKQEKNTIKSSV